jgi:hypothetical protein
MRVYTRCARLHAHTHINACMHTLTYTHAYSQTIDQLNQLLDVEKPFTILLHDRTGISEIRPETDVTTQYGGPAEMDPLEIEEIRMREVACVFGRKAGGSCVCVCARASVFLCVRLLIFFFMML